MKSLIRNLAIPAQHYNLLPLEVRQRFHLNSNLRKTGEFIAELSSLTEFCNYGTTLDKTLWDRLMWGINDKSIRTQS